MSQNMSITVLTILIIAAGFYFMYGSPFSTRQVNYAAYQEMCDKYLSAKVGAYTNDEIQMLVNEINYLVSENLKETNTDASKNLKKCSDELSDKLGLKKQ